MQDDLSNKTLGSPSSLCLILQTKCCYNNVWRQSKWSMLEQSKPSVLNGDDMYPHVCLLHVESIYRAKFECYSTSQDIKLAALQRSSGQGDEQSIKHSFACCNASSTSQMPMRMISCATLSLQHLDGMILRRSLQAWPAVQATPAKN